MIEARRFLHCCYCCPNAEAAELLFVEGLGLRGTMQTTSGRSDGSLLGVDGEIESQARFVYDRRGPRTSPAIEIQGWIDPPAEGDVYADANHVGFHAVGIAVPDLDATLTNLEQLGAAVAGRSDDASAVLGCSRAAVVRAPDDVLIDVVESEMLTPPDTQMHHMRVSCSNIDASIAWYEALGFKVVTRDDAATAPAVLFGLASDGDVAAAQLQLPDEPFALWLHEWRAPIAVGRPYPNANHRGMYRAAICVDDTRAAHATLSGEGVAFARPPRSVELKGTPVPDMWIAFLPDPDGLPIELVERPRRAFR